VLGCSKLESQPYLNRSRLSYISAPRTVYTSRNWKSNVPRDRDRATAEEYACIETRLRRILVITTWYESVVGSSRFCLAAWANTADLIRLEGVA
jgi:hypothetical protein